MKNGSIFPQRKRNFIPSTLLLFILPLCSLRAAWISGRIQNAQPNDRVEVVVPRQYLDGRNETFRTTTGNDQSFGVEVTVPEPQVVFFYFNGDKISVFLSPGDTLIVHTDVFQFPMRVQFGGKAGANNAILQQYWRENPQDFNDFNNVRYKIGQWWVSIEESAGDLMQKSGPEEYLKKMAYGQVAAYTLLEQYQTEHPNVLSRDFTEWLTTDIIYYRAFHLLVYGQVFGRTHQIEDSFFEFLDEIPIDQQIISNDTYRQYIMAYLAYRQVKAGEAGNFWYGMYKRAGDLLTHKALACLRSDIIRTGFYGDQYREMLPAYRDFFQTNPLHEFEPKISDLYQKLSRMATGAVAPSFIGRAETGEAISLTQYRGQVVYLNFWASWCAACLKKMEFFNEFATELNQQGIQIVNISIDENAEKWHNALLQYPSKGIHLLASSGTERNIAQLFGVEAVPQYFIIDTYGNFADRATSGQPNDIREKLLQTSKKQ